MNNSVQKNYIKFGDISKYYDLFQQFLNGSEKKDISAKHESNYKMTHELGEKEKNPIRYTKKTLDTIIFANQEGDVDTKKFNDDLNISQRILPNKQCEICFLQEWLNSEETYSSEVCGIIKNGKVTKIDHKKKYFWTDYESLYEYDNVEVIIESFPKDN